MMFSYEHIVYYVRFTKRGGVQLFGTHRGKITKATVVPVDL